MDEIKERMWDHSQKRKCREVLGTMQIESVIGHRGERRKIQMEVCQFQREQGIKKY